MDRLIEKCPVCEKPGVSINVEIVPLGPPVDGSTPVKFKMKPGVISCRECKAELALDVCDDCENHKLSPL
jgi:transcription elongation factor Elf1